MILITRRTLEIVVVALGGWGAWDCGAPQQNSSPQTPGTTTTTSATSPTPMDVSSVDQEMTSALPPPDVPRSGALPFTPPAMRADARRTYAVALSDAEVAAALDAINEGQIELARVILKTTTSPSVKELAERVLLDHDHAESTLREVDARGGISPEEAPVSDQLKAHTEHALLSLRSAIGDDGDRVYLDAEIEQDEDALDLVDRFLPQVRSAALRSHLSEYRQKAADHLRDTRTVKTFLGNQSKPAWR